MTLLWPPKPPFIHRRGLPGEKKLQFIAIGTEVGMTGLTECDAPIGL
jgi:hypothetical protein